MVGATAAALVAMVARITKNEALAIGADALRAELLAAQRRDEAAYEAVVAAQVLPKADEAQRQRRTEALQRALATAAREPLHAAELCLGVLRLAREVAGTAGPSLVSDAGCAAEFAAAALAASAYNVRVNHRYMTDLDAVARNEADLRPHEREATALLAEVRNLANRP